MPFAAVAAVFTAEAVTATMVFAAVAEVGTALTVVGAVTGDKSLMQVGGVMGIAGGIGGFAAGLGEAGAGLGAGEMTVQTEAQAAAGSDALASNLEPYAASGYDQAIATAQATDFGANAANSADNINGVDPSVSAPADPSSTTTGLNQNLSADLNTPLNTPTPPTNAPPSTMPLDAGTGNPMPPTTAAGDSTAASQLTGGQATSAQNTNVANTTAAGAPPNPINVPKPPATSDSFFGSFKGFLKDNQPLLGQLAGGAMSGMGKAYEADRNFQQKSTESERNYGINQGLFNLRAQQQAFGNSAPAYNYGAAGVNYGAAQPLPPGIINGVRSQ